MPDSDFHLDLPKRENGLTHVIDKGLGPRAWEDVLETSGDFIDIVKLGWGTSYVTNNLRRKLDDGRYEKVCIGTTTSARMVRFTEPLGSQYGVRAICGKGGFPDDAIEPMQRLGMVYFAIVGGAAALETTQIEEIEEVAWEELMPECLWRFRVNDFGPLTVGIDAHGNSLYHDVQTAARAKLKELYARL